MNKNYEIEVRACWGDTSVVRLNQVKYKKKR